MTQRPSRRDPGSFSSVWLVIDILGSRRRTFHAGGAVDFDFTENKHLDENGNNPRQISLREDLDAVISRHLAENNITLIDIVGALEVAKFRWMDGTFNPDDEDD